MVWASNEMAADTVNVVIKDRGGGGGGLDVFLSCLFPHDIFTTKLIVLTSAVSLNHWKIVVVYFYERTR